jgi:hypothetical protein
LDESVRRIDCVLEKDFEVLDIELLDPAFCGLNFSITGNMRAGIFVKEILEKETHDGCLRLNSSDQLRTGFCLYFDRQKSIG